MFVYAFSARHASSYTLPVYIRSSYGGISIVIIPFDPECQPPCAKKQGAFLSAVLLAVSSLGGPLLVNQHSSPTWWVDVISGFRKPLSLSLSFVMARNKSRWIMHSKGRPLAELP